MQLEFPLHENPEGNKTLITTESTVKLIYAYIEKFVRGAFHISSLGSRFPIITATTTQAWKDIADSQYRYGRYTLELEGKLRFGPLGRVRWTTNMGLYSGTAPFAPLELQPANEPALSLQPSFNLLRYFAYVTNQWVRTSIA